MSQGIPVVLARTEIDQYYFDETVARFFPSGDVPALADALVEVLLDSELRDRLTRNATDYVQRNRLAEQPEAGLILRSWTPCATRDGGSSV